MVNCCLMIYVFLSLYNLVYRYFLFERDTSLVIFLTATISFLLKNKLRDLMENGEPRRSTRLNERAVVRDRARGRGRGGAHGRGRGRGRGNQHVPAEAVIQENQNAPVNGQQSGQGGGNHEVPAGVVGQEHQNAPVVVPPQQEDLAQEVSRLREEIRKRDEEAHNRQEQPNQGQHRFLPVQYMPVPEGRWEPIYERFRKQHPPNFEGGSDPMEAEEWLRTVEGIVEYMRLGNGDSVVCAASLLKKDARIWWDVIKQTRDVAAMTWSDFVQVFNNKYYSEAIRSARVNEFTNLRQGKSTVTEYARQFDRLAKFATDLVPTEFLRIHRFTEGLDS
ncbi:hypothetical protein CsatB_001430 [Cannabis sativa]